MKKYLVSIFFALLTGIIIGKYLFSQYDEKETLTPTFNEKTTLYFIQQGVYSTKESMIENTRMFKNYIYTILNEKYYCFIGITKNEKNLKKIEEFYQRNGYVTYVKELPVSNQEFLNQIDEYDTLLDATNDEEAIQTIIEEVIQKYKELVVDNGQNTGNTTE